MSARAPHHQLRPDPLVTAANRLVPVPAEVIHPHVGAHALLTASPVRRASSAADLAPSALRPGAPLRKPKTSAAEAQAQIAAAMQAQDQKTEPGADAQGIEATASGSALAVGARVKILPSATGKKESRWIGKTGTVQRQVGPEAWDVCFTAKVARPITGKNVGEFQSFHVTELEVEAE